MCLGKRSILRRRVLRMVMQIAHRDYECYICHAKIFCGDEHELEVIALRIRLETGRVVDRVETWRSCAFGCNPPDDFDDGRCDHEGHVEVPMPLAA